MGQCMKKNRRDEIPKIVRVPLPKVKKKKKQILENEPLDQEDINPTNLNHEQLLPDKRGEDQTKPHQPYEFKNFSDCFRG